MTKFWYHERYMHHMILMGQDAAIDRSGAFPHHEAMEIIRPIGAVVPIKDFGDIMMERAEYLVNFARQRGKKLYTFWSGGLDSTGVFLALREFANPNELVIVMSESSMDEYPGFYESNIKDKFEVVWTDMYRIWKTTNDVCSDGIAITGEIADQMFGSVKFLDYTRQQLQNNWQDEINKQNGTFVEQLSQFVANSPQPITNLASLYWWLNYATKYQLVQTRMMRNNKTSILEETMFHFYDTKEFNDWSASTPIEDKIPDFSQTTYKMPLRQFILKIGKDENYANNKIKVRSLHPRYGRLSSIVLAVGITNTCERVYE